MEAYTLWCWALSSVNQGKISQCKFEFKEDKGQQFFKFDVGTCGDFRLVWFGDYLNNFVNYIPKAKVEFPAIKERATSLFMRLKEMKNDISKYLGLL